MEIESPSSGIAFYKYGAIMIHAQLSLWNDSMQQ
jgi:hypothetical protein